MPKNLDRNLSREWKHFLAGLTEDTGVNAELSSTDTNHPIVVLTKGKRSRRVYIASVPGDWRTIVNQRTIVRRIARQLVDA